jgi:hypothetical protein
MMRNSLIIIIFYKIGLTDEVVELPVLARAHPYSPVLTHAHLKLTQLARAQGGVAHPLHLG